MEGTDMLAVPHTIQLYRGTSKRRHPSSNATTMTMTPDLVTSHPRSSPSSVLAMVPSPAKSKQKKRTGTSTSTVRRSIVMMDDNGAELVAEFDSLSVGTHQTLQRTPRKAVRSLLDDEQSSCYTPTPPPSKMPRTPTSTSTDVALCWPTSYNFDCLNKYDNGILELMKLQRKIHAMLGDPNQFDAFFRDWQMWSYFGMTAIPASTNQQVKEEEVKKALRNSITLGLERRHRMDSVRKELNPFSLTPNRQKRSPVKLGTVKSFDITGHSPMKSRGGVTNKNDSNLSGLVSMLERGCLCPNTSKAESPALIRSGMLNAVHEETCYDSDPEDFTRRRPRKLHSNSPPSPSNKENRNHNIGSTPHNLHSGVSDDDVIAQMVQEFMNEKFTLILHARDQPSKSSTPHAIKAWFERGQHLGNGSVIQPRFMWHLVQRNKKSQRKITLPTTGAVSFDLVDVARVLAVDTVDRKLYPFAKPASCFLLKTIDKSFLFETKSAPERERIVRLLKLVVARLGSKLIVGDQSFFEEFFITGDGPGEAPF